MKFPLSHSRLEVFEKCPLQFEYLYIEKTVVSEPNIYSEFGNRVHESLEKYGKSGDETFLTLETQEYKHLVDNIRGQLGQQLWEHQMAVRADLTPCGWFDKDVWLRGIADVLVINGTTAYCLDWKTGKVKPNSAQLALFACMVFWHFPEVERVVTSFIWLKHDTSTLEMFYRDNLPREWQPLNSRFGHVQEAVDLGVFEPKPNYGCRWCPAKRVCAYA